MPNLAYIDLNIKATKDAIMISLRNAVVQADQLGKRAELEESRAERFQKALVQVENDLNHLREFVPADTVYGIDKIIDVVNEALYS